MTRQQAMALLTKDVRVWPIAKAIFWAALALLGAAGFGFRTPVQRFDEQDARIFATEQAQRRTDENFRVLFRLSCVDRRYTQRDRLLSGLNCDQLLNTDVRQAGQPTRVP